MPLVEHEFEGTPLFFSARKFVVKQVAQEGEM